MKNKLKLILFLPLLTVFLSGCILQVKTEKTPDGGIYRSTDSAANWENKSLVLSVGEQNLTLNDTNVEFLYLDPSDNKTLYVGTREKGVFVSWDGAETWRSILSNKGNIISFAVDQNYPCTLYAASSKEIYKSIDCGRKWRSIFYEKRNDATITKIVIDPEDSSRIFMGTSVANRGEIIWSQDYGESWQVLRANFKSPVQGIYINPKNPMVIYAALKKGFYRSSDKGIAWEDLSPRFNELDLKNADEVIALEFIPSFEDGILIASKYGLLRSENSGVDWQAYILLQQPNTANIQSLVLNKKNENEIIYGTDRGIYRSVDGGANWTTIKPPTARLIKSLIMDPEQTNILYLGGWLPSK